MNNDVLFLAASTILVSSASAAALAYLKYKGGGLSSGAPFANLKGTPLPVPTLEKNKRPWNIIGIGNEENLSISGTELTIDLKKGKHGSKSGGSFRSNPNDLLPAEAITFSYEVYFHPSFNWVKGGKLPGVCLGQKEVDCSTGGEWSPTQGSFRIMFRENGVAIGYSYMAIKGGSDAAFSAQGNGYKKIAETTGGTGHNLWRHTNAGLKFTKGWNTVTMDLKLNTPGQKNGMISLTINGVNRIVRDVAFRESSSVKFTNVLVVSFFGGGSDDYNSPVDTYVKFRNFRFDAR